jgi:hypothetical protein
MNQPEPIASLLAQTKSLPPTGSFKQKKFSFIRLLSLIIALFTLYCFIMLSGGISLDGITTGAILCILAAVLLPILLLLKRHRGNFLMYLYVAISSCIIKCPNNLKHRIISVELVHLSLGVGVFALIIGMSIVIFSPLDHEKIKIFAIPIFWGSFVAMILCLFSLFQKHTSNTPVLDFLDRKTSREIYGDSRIYWGYVKTLFSLIIIPICWIFGFVGMAIFLGILHFTTKFLFSESDPSQYFPGTEALFSPFIVPIILFATFPDEFPKYFTSVIANFFRKQKRNFHYVEISRVGSEVALYGVILALTFSPITWWFNAVGTKNLHYNKVFSSNIGTFLLGLITWSIFRYFQYSFSLNKSSNHKKGIHQEN